MVEREWTGKGWYSRGYFGDRQIGKGMPFMEPQPWALLAGVPTREQSRTLVAQHPPLPHRPRRTRRPVADRQRDGAGARRPGHHRARPGARPDRGGPPARPARPGAEDVPNAPLAGAAAYPGGVWFDPNGWLTWALGELEGVVPNAEALAWDEYTRNTLAAHATAFPDHWNGTISIDDACNAWYSSDPSRCGIGVPSWQGQITEQPTWMVMNALRLAGVTPTRDGLPHRPAPADGALHVRMPRAGVAA